MLLSPLTAAIHSRFLYNLVALREPTELGEQGKTAVDLQSVKPAVDLPPKTATEFQPVRTPVDLRPVFETKFRRNADGYGNLRRKNKTMMKELLRNIWRHSNLF